MRIIAIGCEYGGVTTLLNGLNQWGTRKTTCTSIWTIILPSPMRTFPTKNKNDADDVTSSKRSDFSDFRLFAMCGLSTCASRSYWATPHRRGGLRPRYYYPGLQVSA